MFRLCLDKKLGKKCTNWKRQVSKSVKVIMKYNPRLADLSSLLKKHMPLLYTGPTLKTIFLQGCINSVFKRKSVPSLYPNKKVIRTNSIPSCNICRCGICKNYLICSNCFTCSITNRIENIIQGGLFDNLYELP